MSTEKRPGVAAAIYEDVISPAAREVGGALEKLVRLGLLPVNFAVDGFTEAAEAALQNARERLARKRVPKERIVTPPPEVTVPVVNSLRIRGGDEGIRDMYLNLLAGAMDSSTQRLAHPAFADIIRQLTPFEAKVIPLFDPPFQSHSMFPLVRLIGRRPRVIPNLGGHEQWTVSHYFSDLFKRVFETAEDGVARPFEHDLLSPGSIDNFVRLGLSEIPANFVMVSEDNYKQIEEFPAFQELRSLLAQGAPELSIVPERRTLVATDFGRQFARICTGTDWNTPPFSNG